MQTKKLIMYSKTINGLTHTLKVEGNKLVFERSGTVYDVFHGSKRVAHHISLPRAQELARQAADCGQHLRLERVDLA